MKVTNNIQNLTGNGIEGLKGIDGNLHIIFYWGRIIYRRSF